MANFTPQEIEEILQQFFNATGKRQYVGARYVPIFGRKNETSIAWDNSGAYEPLTIVLYNGDSYTSKRYVPAGIDITDTNYWVITGRYNAQVEQYRQEVLGFDTRITTNTNDINSLEDIIPASDFDSENTVKAYIDDENEAQTDALKNILLPFPDSAFYPKLGTLGQVLTTLADGTTKWENPVVPSDAQAEEVISAWLTEHPEATTTVQDGAITFAKLYAALVRRLIIGADSDGTASDNLNDLTRNTVTRYGTGVVPTNAPLGTNVGGMLVFTLNNGASVGATSVALQLAAYLGANVTQAGLLYFRTRWGASSSQWSAWKSCSVEDGTITLANLTDSLTKKLLVGYGTISTDMDLNDIQRNTVYVFDSTIVPTNSPLETNSGVMIITIGNGSSNIATSIGFQIAAYLSGVENGRIFMRTRYGASSSVWSDWLEVGIQDGTITPEKLADSLTKKLIIASGNNSTDTDLDDMPRNNITIFTAGTEITNMPLDSHSGLMVITIGGGANTSLTSVAVQICAYLAGPNKPRMFYRVRYGSSADVWSDWKEFAKKDTLKEQDMFDISMFRTMTAIGDSWTAGSVYTPAGDFVGRDGNETWCANLARKFGIEMDNYGTGGWAAYDFIHGTASQLSLTALINDITTNGANAFYVIAFGINDSRSGHTMGGLPGGTTYVGSSADINTTDYTQNANSFWGCMSWIISALKEYAPNSKIALLTIMSSHTTVHDLYSEAIRDIAEYHDILCIDVAADEFVDSDQYTAGLFGGHPSYIMQTGLSKAIERQFSIAASNTDYLYSFYGAAS